MIRLLIADEHPVVRQGLKSLLSQETDMTVVAEVDAVPAMVQATVLHQPDIVLLDLCFRRHRIAEAVEEIKRLSTAVRFVVFTTFQGADEVALSQRAKIQGYVLKTDEPGHIIAAIRAVFQGGNWLSPKLALELGDEQAALSLTEREREVLGTIATGKSNLEAADALFISEGTVKFHINNIVTKLGADDRTEAVVIGLQRGLLRLAE